MKSKKILSVVTCSMLLLAGCGRETKTSANPNSQNDISSPTDEKISSSEKVIKKTKINLDLNGGKFPSETSINIEFTYWEEIPDSFFDSYKPIRKGYTFLGWSYNGTILKKGDKWKSTSAGAKLKAMWEAETYHITYNLNGGTNSDLNPDTYTIESSDITLFDATKSGAQFAGWYCDGELIETINHGSHEDINLEARWNALHNLVLTSSDSSMGTVKVVSGTGYATEAMTVLASPVSPATFEGWYSNGVKVSDEDEYTFNMPDNDYVLEGRFSCEPSLSLSTTRTRYEVGETFRLDFSYITMNTDKTLKFALEDQSKSSPVITSKDMTSTALSDGTYVELYASKVGTATLVATSATDENLSIKVKITVTEKLSTLENIWKNLNTLNNYTLNISHKATDSELAKHSSWTSSTKVPGQKIEVTQNALLKSVAVVNDDLSKTSYKPAFSKNGNEVLGLAVDSNDYVFTILKDSSNNYLSDERIINAGEGFVSKENLSGFGDEASSPNQVYSTINGSKNYTFAGLRAVNSSWLSSIAKDNGNEYELYYDTNASSEVKEAISYAKCALWEIIDIDSFALASTSGSTFTSLAGMVKLKITCESQSLISIQLETSTNTFYMEMSSVSTTSHDVALDTFLGSAASALPDIQYADLKNLQALIAANDFYETISTSYGDYYIYYTSNYKFTYYPLSFINSYKNATGQTIQSNGFFLKDTKIYSFWCTDPYKDTTGEHLTIHYYTIPTSDDSGNTIICNSTADFAKVCNNYGATKTFSSLDTGYMYCFDYQFVATTGETVYYTTNKNVSDDLYNCSKGCTLKELIEDHPDLGFTFEEYWTQFQITKTNNSITKVRIFLGSFTTSSGTGKGYVDDIYFTSSKNNGYHNSIINLINNFTPADN